METFDFKGRTAVITGAAGGIGRALAVTLATRGTNLALADINEVGLAETAALIGNAVRVTCHRFDVADREAIAALPQAVLAAHDGVDILINNAGVALGGTFEQVTEAEFDWLMDINFYGVVRMTRVFLPILKNSRQAQLVNISSLFGLIAPPGQTAYAAAKFGVRGFSQALRHELEAQKSTVGVTVVHPGGVRTGIAANAHIGSGVTAASNGKRDFDKLLRMMPEEAAAIIVEAIEKRRPRLLVGRDAKIAAFVERLMPAAYWSLLARNR